MKLYEIVRGGRVWTGRAGHWMSWPFEIVRDHDGWTAWHHLPDAKVLVVDRVRRLQDAMDACSSE